MTSDAFNDELLRLRLREISEKAVRLMGGFCEAHSGLFENKGDMIEARGPNALHYPGLEATVRAAKLYLTPKFGETLITNDCYSGNPRLCDLVLIQGVFGRTQANELRYFAALQLSLPQLLNRNLGGLSTSVEEEGYRIPPAPLEAGNQINTEIVQYLCQSEMNQDALLSILSKAREVLKLMGAELMELEGRFGRDRFSKGLERLKAYSEKMMRGALHEIPDGEYTAVESLESDGFEGRDLKIQCKLSSSGENILVSFLGTTKQTKGPFNCNYVMTLGATFWALRGMLNRDIPNNSGALKAFSVEAPEGTLVNARYPAPLLGGYFETSKKIIDVLYGALNKALPGEVPAHNGGSSSAVLCQLNHVFLEISGQGAGASKNWPGESALFTDLSNGSSRSIEEIESHYPLVIDQSSLRVDSGGLGRFPGGSGISRTYTFLQSTKVLVFGDKRTQGAKGLFGGGPGHTSEVFHVQGSHRQKIMNRGTLTVNKGDKLVINSPGGGAWGKKEDVEATGEE